MAVPVLWSCSSSPFPAAILGSWCCPTFPSVPAKTARGDCAASREKILTLYPGNFWGVEFPGNLLCREVGELLLEFQGAAGGSESPRAAWELRELSLVLLGAFDRLERGGNAEGMELFRPSAPLFWFSVSDQLLPSLCVG